MNASTVARTEFAAAIAQISNERKIAPESIYEGIKLALVSAYRKQIGEYQDNFHYYATLNEDSGEAQIFKAPITKKDEETGETLEFNESKALNVTPAGFGRIAAQTAKQVILQKIREAEKDQVIADFQDRIGEIITGTVMRMEGRNVIIDLGRGYAQMPPEEQMRGEFYRMNMRIVVFIKDIRETSRGRSVIVSRSDKDLVVKLFEREVPEVATGSVKVVSVAREAGVRTKMAVSSGDQEGVDPVGSCVGQRGVRVQEVIRELNNEKIDIIPYHENPVLYMKAALAPADSLLIDVDSKTKKVTVVSPDDQLSLAIGRGGQNVRLAAKLTGYQITIKSQGGSVESQVTGREEYEIDTIKGLSSETRQKLVTFKLITLSDLQRFREKWQSFEEIDDKQVQILNHAITDFEKTEASFNESRDAHRGLDSGEKSTDNSVENSAENPSENTIEKSQESAKKVSVATDSAETNQ
jgi:transcription termination/antitermination protein NusA